MRSEKLMKNIYIIDGARTAFTSFGGSFSQVTATELGVATAKEALKRSQVKPDQIDHVYYGNVIHSSENAAYLARHIGLGADIPEEVGALTLNRLCGSGLQSIISRSEEHTSELQSRFDLVCRLLLEKKNKKEHHNIDITN